MFLSGPSTGLDVVDTKDIGPPICFAGQLNLLY